MFGFVVLLDCFTLLDCLRLGISTLYFGYLLSGLLLVYVC